jgi:hypothetical protein
MDANAVVCDSFEKIVRKATTKMTAKGQGPASAAKRSQQERDAAKAAVTEARHPLSLFISGTVNGFGNGMSRGGRLGGALGLVLATVLFFAPLSPLMQQLMTAWSLPAVGTGLEAIVTAVMIYGFGGLLTGMATGAVTGLLFGGIIKVRAAQLEKAEAEAVLKAGDAPPASNETRNPATRPALQPAQPPIRLRGFDR